MSRTKLQPPKRGRKAIYNWPRWENGSIHTARHGQQFRCSVAAFIASLRMRAAKIGQRVTINIVNDTTVKFQFATKTQRKGA